MKNMFRKCVLALGLVAMCSSCEDFLQQDDPNKINAEIYWRNLEEVNSGINAIYNGMRNHFIYNFGTEAVRSDMGWPGYGRPVPQAATNLIWYQHTYDKSIDEIRNKWNACYTVIFRANQVISGLEKIEGDYAETEETALQWSSKMAEARFFRGLMHFYLYNAYNKGSIAICDKVVSGLDQLYSELSPADKVLEFVRKDLQYAYENLPEVQTEQGRPSKGTAATILGTSYLYNEEYDEAAVLFEDVINNPAYGYKLVTDMNLLFTNAGEFNSESIFEIEYNTEFHPEIPMWNEMAMHNRWARYCGSGSVGASVPAWLAYTYSKEPQDLKDERNLVPGMLPGSMVARNVPLRCSAMCAVASDIHTPYYDKLNAAEGGKILTELWGFGWHKKYTNHSLGIACGDEDGKSGKNVTLNRLSDVYLMLAECKIQSATKQDIPEALRLINEIRKRWGLVLLGQELSADRTYDKVDYTAESLMEHLMYTERPLELSVEGHMTRWLDLRRWGVIKERFQDLASRTYYANNFVIPAAKSSTGSDLTVKKCFILETNAQSDPLTYHIVNYEYKDAAMNYNPAIHDYYPIPEQEEINNPNI